MKRIAALALVLLVPFAACGGDDDDDTSSSGGGGDEAAAEDFCEIWPEVNSDESTLDDGATEEQIAEAREVIDRIRAAAPEEIEDEVTQLADAIEGLVDTVADGGSIEEEDVFGELFGLLFSVGPPIEEWMVDNCPDYDPASSGFGVEEDDGTGVLGIDQGVLDDIRLGLTENDMGASSTESPGEYEWTWYFDGDGDAAVALCEAASERLAAEGVDGTLVLRISTQDDTVLAVNESVTPGDAGTCEAA